MLATQTNESKSPAGTKASSARRSARTRKVSPCGCSAFLDNNKKKISTKEATLIFDLLKNELRHRAENGGDLKSFKKLPKALKEKLIVAIEDEDDIAATDKIMKDIKLGKAKLIPWEEVKAKHGL